MQHLTAQSSLRVAQCAMGLVQHAAATAGLYIFNAIPLDAPAELVSAWKECYSTTRAARDACDMQQFLLVNGGP